MDEDLTQPDNPTCERVWYAAFLAVLAMRDNVSEACRESGISRQTAYEARKEDAAFRQKWDDASAEASDALEAEARRRAEAGVEQYVIHKGDLVWVWMLDGEIVEANEDGTRPEGAKRVPLKKKEYSDSLMQTLLKAAKREKYSERIQTTSMNVDLSTLSDEQLERLANGEAIESVLASPGTAGTPPATGDGVESNSSLESPAGATDSGTSELG